MKGAEALPTQYAMSMMAFVVTRLVCPAVTLESHDSDSTKPVVPTPVHEQVRDQFKEFFSETRMNTHQ